MRTFITALMLLATLGLVSCGGGNDVASSGASAVSAAAPVTTTTATASAPSTAATEPKVNGQVDERTGVAPVVAQMTPWSPTANGGCANSWMFGYGNGPTLTNAQYYACSSALGNVSSSQQCTALGGLVCNICGHDNCRLAFCFTQC